MEKTKYEKRVLQLEAEGMTTSDAQGVAEIEALHAAHVFVDSTSTKTNPDIIEALELAKRFLNPFPLDPSANREQDQRLDAYNKVCAALRGAK